MFAIYVDGAGQFASLDLRHWFNSTVTGKLLQIPRRSRRRLDARTVESLSDPELLGRIGDDESALRELVTRHQTSLQRFATAVLGNRADAEEAVQDTFVRAHSAGDSFRGDASVRSWLHTICYRQCLTRTRRKRHQVASFDINDARWAYEPDATSRIALEIAVTGLSEEHRVAFALIDVLGFSREDAALLVGVQGNTMRARSARARVLLADLLSEAPDQPT